LVEASGPGSLGIPARYLQGGTRKGKKVSFRLRNESGFSLMEVMVSVIVFSIAIVFLYQMLFSGRMQVEFEGERRVASKAAELKIEELKYAGYGSTDAGADWTSLAMDIGTHPSDPRIVLDDRGTPETQDDLVGLVNWTVRDTLWLDSGIMTEAKVVDLTLQWPESWVRDNVRVVTVVAK
jgi:prepilin-type N-terminal cleavage/methylation domain-containing protein